MTRLGAVAFATALVSVLEIASLRACQAQAAQADFGAPPSGEIPIIFNDRHVYAKPDRLRSGRVLAALVRHGTILVPLRSLFEQMGASVAYDRTRKTIDVTKAGATVRVTVGKPEVTINGETRPLDVPPEIDGGSVLVPLRVISEGMGAFVMWLPDKRVVVVRYLAAPAPTAPPAPEPSPSPSPFAPPTTSLPPAPTPPSTPASKSKPAAERFVVGDYVFSPKVYTELSPGNSGRSSFHLAAAAEFALFNLPWMLEGDFRSIRYPHKSGAVTGIGAQRQAFVPSFEARDDDFDGRFGLKISDPRIYVGVGYVFRNTNYEGGLLPTQVHGVGGGLEKLPDLDKGFSLYGSAYYFPSATTNDAQVEGNGALGSVQYRILKYGIGGTFNLGKSPVFLDLGYLGDQLFVKQDAPVGQSHTGAYAGLGVHF